MKIQTLCTIIFFCWSISSLTAQKYQPLLEEGKTWDVFYWKGATCYIPNCAAKRFFLQEDTIYNNISYKILSSRRFRLCESVPGMYSNPCGFEEVTELEGFIREDTIAKKVFLLEKGTNLEYVLYDFSLQVGDSITLQDFPVFPAIVDSIGTMTDAAGIQRRLFYFSWQSPQELYMIEGIGGNGGLLSPLCYCFEQGSDMTCVKKENEILWNIGGRATCDILLDTKVQLFNSDIKIYPNPTANSLFIEGLENFSGTVTLFDYQGKIFLTQSFENQIDKTKIDLHHLPKGIFFCQIQTEHGIMMQKFIRH